MFAKIKSSNFIDVLQFELTPDKDSFFRCILKDDKGSVCGVLERNISQDQKQLSWSGLNDLPYGKYTLELLHGKEEMKLNLVKRV